MAGDFLALLVVVCAAAAYRYVSALKRRAASTAAELARAQRDLMQLSARLSRELHDEIGQALALVEIEISQTAKLLPLKPEAAADRLRRAKEIAARAVESLRDISVLLRPALPEDVGLVPALQFQLDDFLRRTGIDGEFSAHCVPDELPEAVKTCVYRTVQEALHNCEKHSGAAKVRVSVRQVANSLTAEVEDNGRGFVPSQTAGLGLIGIRERVAAAGGAVTVDTAPGQGARIAISIPLAPARQVAV